MNGIRRPRAAGVVVRRPVGTAHPSPRSRHMVKPCRRNSKRAFGAFLIGCLLATGCHSQQLQPPVDSQVPRELAKVTLPTYVIEPPDILLVDALRVVPLPPYRIAPLDILFIEVTN